MFLITYINALLATVFAIGAVAFVWSKRSPLELALSAYALTAAVWIGANAIADVAYTTDLLLLSSGIAFIGGAANLFAFLVLVDTVIDNQFPTKRRVLLYALPNIGVSLLAFTHYAITGTAFPPGAPAQIVPGPLYTFSLFLLLAGITYGAGRLLHAIRSARNRERKRQIVFCLAGLLVMLIGELVFDVVLPLMGEFRFYALGTTTSIAFIIGSGFSIVRHRLIDLRLVIKMLERKVAERTNELQSLQEHQQLMMIDLSHNLQTPLAILKTKLERMRRTTANDADIRSLEQSVDALSTFITDLLALANLERYLQEEERTTSSLSELIEEIAEEVSVIATSNGILVESAVSANVCLYGNRKRLREAIMNLANNAVKYMRSEGDKRIRFTLESDSSHAYITVDDTGIGIAPSDLPRVFERFYRGNRMYDAVPGTGLGLAIVDRIVKEHGGAVEVESEPGQGSLFKLRLPLRKEGS